MTYLELKGSKHVYTQDNSLLSIHYFLVRHICAEHPVYGIQISSCRNQDYRHIHVETIPNISYSLDYVNRLIEACMEHLVTPTDLFSSVDLLMDIPMQ